MAKAEKPSLLSYNRSLSPTDGVFRTIIAGGREAPVPVMEKATLGTQSQFVKADATAEKIAYGNPQRVEATALPMGSETLLIDWRLNIIPASQLPQSCNIPEWRLKLANLVAGFGTAGGFQTLGLRYAANVANGRWAFKNRLFATSFKVVVTATSYPADTTVPVQKDEFSFDAFATSLSVVEPDAADVRKLGALIAAGLSGEMKTVRLSVRGILNMGEGAIVYPSQEFAEKDESDGAVGKVLYGIPVDGVARCAAYHEQKIGAALRTIDTWHGGASEGDIIHVESTKPLPVNPYAQDRETHNVVRIRSTKKDLYSILEKSLDKMVDEAGAGIVTNDMLFVVANLIRGGVFGMKDAA